MEINETTLEKFRDYAKEHLGARRLAHTFAVEGETSALCRIFCPDIENELRGAALLHDITKELDTEKQLQLCSEYGIIVDDIIKASPKCFHALTGAAVAADVFAGSVTERMLTAIRYHTTGRADMTLPEKIIYLADYIEPTRTFEDCVALRNYFYSGLGSAEDRERHLDDTLILSFDLLIKDLIADGAPIMPDTVSARNHLCISRK